jgi:hypothetical protein
LYFGIVLTLVFFVCFSFCNLYIHLQMPL